MRIKLTESQVKLLEQGCFVTIARKVEMPDDIAGQLKILHEYRVKNGSLLTGECGDTEVPLIALNVKLNPRESQVEFDIYDQREVRLG